MKKRLLYLMTSSSKFLSTRGWKYAKERSLEGYFDFVVSVHLPTKTDNFFQLNDRHVIVEMGTVKFSFLKLKIFKKILYSLSVFFRLWKLARRYKTNVVRAGDPYFIGLVSWAVARLTGSYSCLALRTPYDLRYRLEGPTIMFPEIFGSRRAAKIIERFVLKKADLIMARSENLIRYALDNGADERKICLDRFGVHTELFLRPAQHNLEEELDLKDKKIVVHVGRLNRENYVYDILEVAKKVCLKFKEVVFVIVGEGPERKNLERLAGEAQLNGRVIFVCAQPYDLIPDYRKMADVNLGLMAGNSLVEAALSGKPVITYDIDWHQELIIHEETGILLPESDLDSLATNIERLIKDPALSERLAKKARERAVRFYSYEKSVKNRRAFYDELFGAKGRQESFQPVDV